MKTFNIYVNLTYMAIGWKRTTALGMAAAPALTVFGFLMVADLVVCLAGLAVDHRVITGAAAWLKPAKFAISTMIAAWSFAWCLASTTVWRGLARVLDWLLAVGLVVEIVFIDLQAARGTSSHFNLSTRFDATVFAVMGVSIACIWLGMMLLTAILFRQPFASAWGWSLRLGMVLAVIGSGAGALMVTPTPQQLAAKQATGQPPINGAHTVGAPDGGPGLPVTHWSADHGDLRVAHFVGMHGLQALPLFAWWVARRRPAPGERAQRHLVFAGFASYLSLFGLLLWQAFRGQSIVQPDKLMAESFAAWLLLTLVTVFAIGPWRSSQPKENLA